GKLYAKIAAAVVAAGTILIVVASQGPSRPSVAAPPPPPPDPRPAQARAELRALLAAFPTWAADHAGAPCPTSAELGGHADPWGHAYELTCTDQPADQIVGARSMGADGAMGTDDDLVSWALDHDVTKLVRGKRWTAAPVAAKQPLLEPAQPAP